MFLLPGQWLSPKEMTSRDRRVDFSLIFSLYRRSKGDSDIGRDLTSLFKNGESVIIHKLFALKSSEAKNSSEMAECFSQVNLVFSFPFLGIQ